jgi:membrane peptidoglycan carboxypeptidase
MVLLERRSRRPRAELGRRLLRRLIVAIAGLAILCALCFAVMAVYVTTLPSVTGAQARVDGILDVHRASGVGMPPPRRLGDAVVAVEDEHFYSNFIVNILEGAGRAALATLHTSQDPGGSTIAQQLAKLLYGRGGGVTGTLREIGLSVKLYLNYSKPRILDMYLNAVYYGHGYYGAQAAARGYFGTSPYDLTWGEAALLAGLPQAPSAYDPLKHLALARLRQRHVLNQLVVNHYLTAAQARAAFRAPLPLRRH